MRPDEIMRLTAAHAMGRDAFCVSFGADDPGEPYSIILSYDGRFPQPWTRVDVSRRICSIISHTSLGNDVIYVAMSDEGDVYFLAEDQTIHEKIPGAGIYSPDSADLGAMSALLPYGDRIVGIGAGSQAYLRHGADDWVQIGTTGIDLDGGALSHDFLGGAVLHEATLMTFGMAIVRTQQMSDEMLERVSAAGARGDMGEVNRIFDQIGAQQLPDQPQVHQYRGQSWSQLTMPREVPLRDMFVENDQRVWIVGLEGAIFVGNPAAGFADVSFHGDRIDLYAITKFREEMIVASGYSLHRFDGHILSPLKPILDPSINNGIPTPLGLQAIDEVMFYFDYKHGVCRWDGETWDWIDIPQELLVRDFKGPGDAR